MILKTREKYRMQSTTRPRGPRVYHYLPIIFFPRRTPALPRRGAGDAEGAEPEAEEAVVEGPARERQLAEAARERVLPEGARLEALLRGRLDDQRRGAEDVRREVGQLREDRARVVAEGGARARALHRLPVLLHRLAVRRRAAAVRRGVDARSSVSLTSNSSAK